MLILAPWMACTVGNLIFNVLPLLTQGQGQFCKFWKSFFQSDLWPWPKRHASVTCNTDWENGVNEICRSYKYFISGFKHGKYIISNKLLKSAGCTVKYGPLKWQIIVHLLTEIYNYLLFHELLLKKSCLQKTYLSYQLESLCKGIQE